jgi:hypothetical protein
MNTNKTTQIVIALLALGIVVAVGWHVISNRPEEPPPGGSTGRASRPTGSAAASTRPPKASQPPPSAEVAQKASKAREALRLVGADAEAQKVWVQAINDPALPANDRQNLIEDLNEEGFSNGKTATLNDLPLITRRLKLIEELMPSALDEGNAAAFREAHKDLTEMYRRLSQPQPR